MLFKEKTECGIERKNEKNAFLTALASAIKKDHPPTSLRKLPNELKVHEKTVGTTIKQALITLIT